MSLGSKIGSVARLTLTFTGCYVVGKSLMRSILGISNSKNSELISMLPTDTRSTFAKLAKTYDRRIQEEEEGEILTIRKNVMNYAYGNVLEVAAGTCRDLPYYDATKVTSLTCADAVPEMLEQGYMIARQHLRRVLGLPKPSTKPIDPNDQDNPEVIKKLKMERKAIKEQVDSVLNDWVMAKSPQEIVDMISKANADGMDAVGDSSLTSSKYPLPHPFNVKPSMTNPGPSTSTGHGSPETSSSSPLSFLPQFGSPPPSVAGSQSPSTSSKQVVTSTTKRVAFPIYFTQVDAMDLRAFPENSFDTVVDTFGLCSIADAERALLEMQRVCKPDGRIILLEHGVSSRFPFYNSIVHSTAKPHHQRWGCVHNKPLEAIIAQAGLKDVHVAEDILSNTVQVYVAKPAKGDELKTLSTREARLLSIKDKPLENPLELVKRPLEERKRDVEKMRKIPRSIFHEWLVKW